MKTCAQCGERNESAAEFCVACLAFLPWVADDPEATVIAPVTPAAAPPARNDHTVTAPAPDATPAVTTPIRADVTPVEITLPAGAGGTRLDVHLFNASTIVDAFVVEVLGPPPWLEVRPVEERLMPDTAATVVLSLRAADGTTPPAGRYRLDLRVRSSTAASVAGPLTVTLTVPPDAAPLVLTTEPTVVRVRDAAEASFVLLVDNAAGNHERRAVLRGSDPERVVRFVFRPPAVDVVAGGRAHVRVTVSAPPPEPGREISRVLTLSSDLPGRPATVTLVQHAAAPVSDPGFEVELTPSLLRARDSGVGRLRVVVDNKRGATGRRVTLTATDPETTMRFLLTPPVLDVPRGGVAEAELRLEIRLPAAGAEVTRPFAVTGWDGTREVSASGSFVVSTSPPPPDRPMTVRLDPSVLRVRDRTSGTVLVIADNRGGARPRSVAFGAYDPERVLRFEVQPPGVMVPAGHVATARVRLWAPRVSGGDQVSRPFTVVAADGTAELETSGTFLQESTDRRPLWRSVLTLAGGALAVAGAFLPWQVGAALDVDGDRGAPVGDEITGVEWALPSVEAAVGNAGMTIAVPDLPDAMDPFVSAGAVLVVLAALAMLGAIGSSGRLTRLCALTAAVLLTGLLVVAAMVPGTGSPGPGALLGLLGCALMFAGGVLARPRR